MTPRSQLIRKRFLLTPSKSAMPISPEAERRLRMHGEEVVKSKVIGDYEFYLTKNRIMVSMPPQIGMQRTGQDFSLITEQQTRKPQEKGSFSMAEAKALITEWLASYPIIQVGSHDPRKARFYERMLKVMGFKLSKTDIAGHDITVIMG